ncbi:hypothetical protein [Rhodobacter lacus]|uniref:Uncharacterized protein n=1 Tax=Rhodobacter lacus TaxID=1641972 RepID=A0ABW5AAY7_9RHOB
MTGQKIVLGDVDFGDSLALPVVRNHALQTNGSLFLVDFASATGALAAAPVNGSSVYNFAHDTAIGMVGSGTEASMAGSFEVRALARDALVELSGKGGLHILYSQLNNDTANRGIFMHLPEAVRAYIVANKGHTFGTAIWKRRTRIAKNAGLVYASLGAAPDYLQIFNGVAPYARVGTVFNSAGAGRNVVGNQLVTLCGNANGFAVNTSSYVLWGNSGPNNSFLNTAPGDLLYLMHVEDLTVSGVTEAQFHARHYEAWGEAFAEGGRLFGDTWTDPATFP